MSLRIAVGGWQHETNSFAPMPTRYEDFLMPGGYPVLSRGAALLPALTGSATALSGALRVLQAAAVTLEPLLWCLAMPAGPIEDAAFERIAAMLCADLSDAIARAPLDGVYLDLHGAALAQSVPDVEGELLRRIRRILGDVPIAISLDPHANFTPAMAAFSDAVAPYRTYPHIDMPAAGARAATLLLDRIRRGAPFAKAYRQVDYWYTLGSQCTMMGPMEAAMAERAAIAERHSVAELGFCFGFPYADFADCGAALSCHAATQLQADAAADEFLAYLYAHEADFRPDAMPAAEAVAAAVAAAQGASRPVIIADTQDNPGGGGHGDTTGLLAELIAQRAAGAVVCLINDAESAAACHEAGAGIIIPLSLGGKSDGVPYVAEARVLRIEDGTFPLTGPMGKGNMARLGQTALVEFEPGVRVIIGSRKIQAYDLAILRHIGVEPTDCAIIAVKSSVHFRADFAPIAERIIVAAAPGPVIADPSRLPFQHVRASVRKRAGS
jgi:microcystin degradation protein MlrC